MRPGQDPRAGVTAPSRLRHHVRRSLHPSRPGREHPRRNPALIALESRGWARLADVLPDGEADDGSIECRARLVVDRLLFGAVSGAPLTIENADHVWSELLDVYGLDMDRADRAAARVASQTVLQRPLEARSVVDGAFNPPLDRSRLNRLIDEFRACVRSEPPLPAGN